MKVGQAILNAGKVIPKAFRFKTVEEQITDLVSRSITKPNVRPAIAANGHAVSTKTDKVKKGSRSGRQKNFVDKPDFNAEGAPHTRINMDSSGSIKNYATFKKNTKNPKGLDLEKRVDLIGKPHINKITGEPVTTPHVIGRDNGKKIPGGVRPAKLSEVPKGRK